MAHINPTIIDFRLPIFVAIIPTGINAMALMPILTPTITAAITGFKFSSFTQYIDMFDDTALNPINHINIDPRINIKLNNFAFSSFFFFSSSESPFILL